MCLKLLPAILLLHVGFVAVLLLAESYGGAVTATQPSMGLLNMTNVSGQRNRLSVTRQYGMSNCAESMALDTRQGNLEYWLDIASTPVDVHLRADGSDAVVSAYRLMHAL
ncbi:hypothetical protein COCC4DRAFT_81049 [Bipolaris maydis ATCC 48331]|uniref:Uncharacterized protein n=2 Tax=Cochliobolus heterostrophus TaxID=5016 RepID=M2SU60_COCH5|nr:uncharacterized protein COCC4DRAFT_81049 [Bipolaris maydis ATCC 48331]EMD88880.1 hypothetical protein COCHEDRAFT_1205981 [Bipolaris maydis C5]ENI05405.1 hypothetical protein COCC4DRAFT_81049 [Bipolaris maydis ATCC 48331]KAJ6205802.1 hypothetical protein PSV09DRAFT_1205981 [Bipolaris maydis]